MKTRVLGLAVLMVFAIGMAVAQTSSPSTQQPASSSTTQQQTSSTTDQSSTTQTTTPRSNAAQTAPDKNADQNAKQTGKLPQTASPLPLLGLLGMGSLAVGAITRRKK
jgi:cytoskeletal protein RodZ